MCSCGLQNRTSYSTIVQQDKSSLPMLKYIHCKYQDQFENLFAQIGINATEANLKALAQAADTGADKAGSIKDKNGSPIFFSVEDTLRKIDASKPVNNSCSI